jgi:hypothetical protein
VNGGDTRVVEGGEHLRFPLEAREALGVTRHFGRQHLDRNVAIELGVLRAVHLAHPARAGSTPPRLLT